MTFQLNQPVTIQLSNSWTYSPPVEGCPAGAGWFPWRGAPQGRGGL